MTDLPPVRITLIADGMQQVTTALRSVEQAVIRNQDKLTRSQVKGGQDRERASKKEADSMLRTQEQAAKRREAAKEREFAKLARQTAKWHQDEINAEKRKNQMIEAEAKKAASARAQFARSIGNNVAGSIRGAVGAGLRLAGAVAAVGGGFGIADALGSTIRDQGKAKEIALQSYDSKTKQFTATKEQVYGTAKAMTAFGLSPDESLRAIDKFGARSGDYSAATMNEVLPQLAEIATATGASLDDLAEAAGTAFGMDTNQGAEKLLATIRALADQGRKGAVDMKDLAEYMSRISATAQQFSGDKVHNTRLMGAYAQLARQKGGASSSAEATESVVNLAADIAEHQKEFVARGIQVKDPVTNQLKDPETVIRNAILATGGDRTQIQKMFGHRSARAVVGLANTYQEAFGAAKKEGKSDLDAKKIATGKMNELLDTFLKAELSKEEISKQSAERLADTDKQLQIALQQLKVQVGDALLPELVKLLPKLQELTPKFAELVKGLASLVEWVAKNPLEAAFVTMGAMMVKGIATIFAEQAITSMVSAAGPAGIVAVATGIAATALIAYFNQKAKTDRQQEGEAAALRDKEELKTIRANVKDLESIPAFQRTDEQNRLLEMSKQQLAEKEAEIRRKVDEKQEHADRIENLQERLKTYGGPTGLEFLGIKNEHAGAGAALNAAEMAELNREMKDTRNEEADKAYVKAMQDAALDLKEAGKALKRMADEQRFGAVYGPPPPPTNGSPADPHR